MIDINRIALQIAERIREKATRIGRIPFDKGDLRKSIFTQLIGTGKAILGSALDYAASVHDGRRRVVIIPRNKKALWWPGAKHPVKKVIQPARAGVPFIKDAAEELAQEGLDFLTPEIRKQIEKELTVGGKKITKIG